MKKWKVLDLSGIDHSPESFESLLEIADLTRLAPTPQALEKHLPKSDAYFAGLKVRLTGDLIAASPRLRAVATPSTGLDHLDLPALKQRGIALISLKDETEFLGGITATAELAWALLLAVVRKLPWAFDAAKQGVWARDRYRGHQISHKTLGILGYGRLGRIVAEYGQAFRMRVIAHDHRPASPAPSVQMVDFDALLRESDFLSVHIHLTPENTGLLDQQAFAKMKPGAVLINTSRGAIVQEADLVQALESGRLGGAGLDVIHGEWNENLADHPLIRYARTHENLVISPHVGGVTFESQAMAFRFTAEKLAAFLRACDAV